MEEDTSQSTGAAREKFWKELTIEQKLERLREFTKRNLEELSYTRDQHEKRLSRLAVDFSQHKHDETTGSPVLPVGSATHMGFVEGERFAPRDRDRRKLENQNPDEVRI